MFESAELGHSISKRTYAREVPKLRAALLDAQYDLFQDGRFPVMVLIAGVDGAGKGETVNLLNEWMDPRHIRVAAFGGPSDEERQQTAFKRFKITPEDWRNRKKWEAYEQAVCDVVDRTSTAVAPSTLVEANDKLHARIKVLKTICERLESALKR